MHVLHLTEILCDYYLDETMTSYVKKLYLNGKETWIRAVSVGLCDWKVSSETTGIVVVDSPESLDKIVKNLENKEMQRLERITTYRTIGIEILLNAGFCDENL